MAQHRLSVKEATGAYEPAMRNVLPAASGICRTCGTWIDAGYRDCSPCNRSPDLLQPVVPITYSRHLGQIHTALRNYKDGTPAAQAYAIPRLTAILWRFIQAHETCVAQAAGISGFDLVTTVPSSTPEADERRTNLRRIVKGCMPLSTRYIRVLQATGKAPAGRAFHADRYTSNVDLAGRAVLLIDDTWTTGGHAQSASVALRAAGATAVGFVAIGRHVNPSWQIAGTTSGELLAALPRRFAWDVCRVHTAD